MELVTPRGARVGSLRDEDLVDFLLSFNNQTTETMRASLDPNGAA